MKGLAQDIEGLATRNDEFREVLYTAKNCRFAPPNHRDGVVHHTRADAEADTEHFHGKTSE